MTQRATIAMAVFVAVMIAVPFVVSGYLLSVLTLVLYLAFLGQAWNLMMGFAGLLSLGHALYVGLGAYASAVLFLNYGVPPLLGALAGAGLAAAIGAAIGFLGFRFSIHGVHFALLTIAFAEFTRILFDHLELVGGSAGLFLPVRSNTTIELWLLRGPPAMFYWFMLALTLAALALCRWLLGSRMGFYWRAIRDDPEAAQALGIDLFCYRMLAVVLSAAMAALAGTFHVFYFNNLFPGDIFSIDRSIELLLGAIVGGVGTLIGPILGAFILTPLGEAMTALTQGLDLPGLKQFVYGIAVALIVLFRPEGVWPWLARRLKL
jgi:branched-chain amino acid transport system permease protein